MSILKDKVNGKHKRDLIYYTKCPEQSCTQDYLGETGRRIMEGVVVMLENKTVTSAETCPNTKSSTR